MTAWFETVAVVAMGLLLGTLWFLFTAEMVLRALPATGGG